KAESTWKEALSIHPSDKEIYLGAVEFYYQDDRVADIERILRDVQTRSPKDPAASLLLAEIYSAKNRPSDGLNLLLDLEKQFPSDLDVAQKLAASFMDDQPDRAQAEIDRVLKAEPKNPAGYVLLGELQFKLRKYDEAEKTLEAAAAMDSFYPQT